MSEEIIKPQPTGTTEAGFERNLRNLETIWTVAEKHGKYMGAAGYFRNNAAAAVILSFHALLAGKSPMEEAQRLHFYNGNFSKKAEVMLANFLEIEGNKWEWINFGDDGKEASARITAHGQTQVLSYKLSDAVKAKLTDKDNWKQNPGPMMRARLTTKAMKMMEPRICEGMSDFEEFDISDAAPHLDLDKQAAVVGAVALATQPVTNIVDAIVTEKPSSVAAKVAQEMKERAEQPLPADIQPPQAQATVGIITTPALPLAETPKTAAAVTSAMPLTTQQWLADWCKPVGVIAATEFMRAKEWLPKDGNLEDLSESFVSLIKKKPVVVLNQIKAHAAKQSSPA